MSVLPPGMGPVTPPSTDKEEKESETENPVDKVSHEVFKTSDRKDSQILKSRNFRELAGDLSFSDYISIIWEKFLSLFPSENSPNKAEEDIRDDISYKIAEEETKSAVPKPLSEQDRVEVFLNAQLEKIRAAKAKEPLPEKTEKQRGLEAAKNLGEQIEKFENPVVEEARRFATSLELKSLNELVENRSEALEKLNANPNDENISKLMQAMTLVRDKANYIINIDQRDRKNSVKEFEEKLKKLEDEVKSLKEPQYSVDKESSGNWRIYVEAKNQLNRTISDARAAARSYEEGKAPFSSNEHLNDIKAVILKLKEAIEKY